MNDCWDQAALRRLLDAIDNEPPCRDPDCDVCHPPAERPPLLPGERPPVRASNTTTALIVIGALMLIIALGVILS